MQYVVFPCRLAVAAVFLVAAVSKLRNRAAFDAFRDSVNRLVPGLSPVTTAVAAVVCVVEIAVVALLAAPVTVAGGYVLALVVLSAFTAAIASALRRGVRAPCRCFGVSENELSVIDVFRNGLLGVVAAAGLISQEIGPGGGVQPAGVVLSLAVGGVFVVGLVFIDDFVSLFRAG